MAELTFKSAGVSLREIDLSGQTDVSPVGTPAAVIGTSEKGPAFVPTLVANFQQFTNRFGETDGEKFGPLAMYEWLKNSQSGMFVRVLGVGDGKKRTTSGNNAGKVNNAGFVVGAQLPQSNGDFGNNPFAVGAYTGRTFFLGCFMSESAGSTIFSESGIQSGNTAVPIIRGVVLVPSGVTLSLSGSSEFGNTLPQTSAASATIGFMTGAVDLSGTNQKFTLFLSGHISNDRFGNTLEASFNPTSPSYFANIFNTDPTQIEEAGHFLYSHYDVYDQYAVPTGSNLASIGSWPASADSEDIAFVVHGSQTYNSGSLTIPNFESFEDRFRTALSPWVVSQKFGGNPVNLFKVHARDDGAYANQKIKISIRNLTPSTDPTSLFSTFDLFVRDFSDTDENPVVLESFIGLSLNPNSERYISRIIGDTHTFYDFDRDTGSQKLVIEGSYPNVSQFIRVETSPELENEEIPENSIPFGFRGVGYLLTSGSLNTAGANSDNLNRAVQPPLPLRKTIAEGTGLSKRPLPFAHWGVQFEVNDSITEPNKNNFLDETVSSYTKYFPRFHTDWKNPWEIDTNAADSFGNNAFSLEQVQVYTASNGLPNSRLWASASYSRDPSSASSLDRFLEASDLSDSTARRFAKFSFIVQGGFDGVNILNTDKSQLSNNAAKREMDFVSTQGGPAGATVASYRKAIDILAERTNADIQLLAIPGLREPGVVDYAIDATETRFDALYIADIPLRNSDNQVITSSVDTPSVSLIANDLSSRSIDSSFAAAYFPDVVMIDPTTRTNVTVPPSVAVLGAFSLNDRIAYPWFAPAGFTRGALSDVVETQVKLNRNNLDVLYSANINPITTVPASISPIVFGQKTLLARASALDRVNVRRLLIEIRRRVRQISNSILFEPNREETLTRFSGLVNPVLEQIQSQQGIDRFRVRIDTSTTTQADIENNTIRGKIFVQPTRSIEFVSLDFVVTNAGAEI